MTQRPPDAEPPPVPQSTSSSGVGPPSGPGSPARASVTPSPGSDPAPGTVPSPPGPAALPDAIAGAVTFGASGAVLVLEITALRLIAPYVGITMETNTAVIGLALAAIALGAWSGGATADRREPRGLLGPLMILGGALTLAITPAVRWVAAAAPPAESAGLALMLAVVTVFAPAAVLSAIPPMVVKLQLAALTETGAVVGRLSAIGTLGAIAATFLTGFVLVALVPTSIILTSTGVLLVAAGLALVLSARRHGIAEGMSTTGALVLAVVAGGLGLVAPDPCDVETRYHCASVVADADRSSGRTLVLDTLRHSYIDLEDPTYLEFDYVRAIAGALDAHAPAGEPLDVLHVGGGAMTLPRYLLATRPEGHNTVVEIDPGIVEVDRERLALPDSDRLEVRVADGRIEVSRLPTDSYDVYVGDAFGGIAVPWHLTTRETFADIDRVLRPGGLVALNIIDFGDLGFLAAEIATVRSVFPNLIVYQQTERPNGGGNFVVLASHDPLDEDRVGAAVRAQRAPMAAMSSRRVNALEVTADVLTDDHAPVDQLVSQS